MKELIKLSESKIHEIIKESVNKILNEAVNTDDILDTVLKNQELLQKAITTLSPRSIIYPKGTKEQQNKWRMDEFINQTPELFKSIMSIPKRKEIAKKIYSKLVEMYPQYF